MNRSDFRYASTRVYVSNQMKTCAFAQASTLLALDAKTSVFKEGDSVESVSYTHLTLPTSDLV